MYTSRDTRTGRSCGGVGCSTVVHRPTQEHCYFTYMDSLLIWYTSTINSEKSYNTVLGAWRKCCKHDVITIELVIMYLIYFSFISHTYSHRYTTIKLKPFTLLIIMLNSFASLYLFDDGFSKYSKARQREVFQPSNHFPIITLYIYKQIPNKYI